LETQLCPPRLERLFSSCRESLPKNPEPE
jgi:hypothetical protein